MQEASDLNDDSAVSNWDQASYTRQRARSPGRHRQPLSEERLLDVVRAHAVENAPEIQAAILESIRAFVGDAPQFDDITLMTLKRE